MAENYSEIENKEDSLDQVLKLAGLPAKFKLRAHEFNLIKTKINHLKFLIDNLNLSGGQGIPGIKRKTFKYNILNFGLEAFQVHGFINSRSAFEVAAGEIPSFLFFINNMTTGLPLVEMYSVKGDQEGIYGDGGTRILQQQDLQLEYERIATADEVDEDPETQTITFPNLSGNIENWLNTQDPPIVMQSASEGLVIFRGTILGEQVSFLFVGPRDTYGENQAQSISDHFEPLQEAQQEGLVVDQDFNYQSLNPVQNRVITAWKKWVETQLNLLDQAIQNGGGGGGAVDSVNGKTGAVQLFPADISIDTATLTYLDAIELFELAQDIDFEFAQVYDDLINIIDTKKLLTYAAQTLTEQQQKQARDNTKSAEKYSRVTVSASRNLNADDNGKLLIITTTSTLTFGSNLPTDFNFNYKVKTGASVTFTNGTKTIQDTEGTVVSSITAGQHAFGTCFEIEPDVYMFEGKYN